MKKREKRLERLISNSLNKMKRDSIGGLIDCRRRASFQSFALFLLIFPVQEFPLSFIIKFDFEISCFKIKSKLVIPRMIWISRRRNKYSYRTKGRDVWPIF